MFSGKTGAPVPSGIKSDVAMAEKPTYGLARAAIEVVFNGCSIATLTQTGVRPPVSLEGVGVRLPVGSPRGLPLHVASGGVPPPPTSNSEPDCAFPAPPASPLTPRCMPSARADAAALLETTTVDCTSATPFLSGHAAAAIHAATNLSAAHHGFPRQVRHMHARPHPLACNRDVVRVQDCCRRAKVVRMGGVVCGSVGGVRGVHAMGRLRMPAEWPGEVGRRRHRRVTFRVPTAGSRCAAVSARKGFDPAPDGPGLAGGWS